MILLPLASFLFFSHQPSFAYYQSVELIALSGASMVGVADHIQPPAPGGEQTLVCVVFRRCQAISSGMTFPETGAFLKVEKSQVDEWIRTKARIVSYGDGGWLNLDDPKTVMIDHNLRKISTAEECIRLLQATYWEHPEVEKPRIYYRPVFDDEAKRLGLPQNARVGVPYDRSVEKWALECIGSKDWIRRVTGAQAMRMFKSSDNIRRMKALLEDPYEAKESDGRSRFPVRQSATYTLQGWGELPPGS